VEGREWRQGAGEEESGGNERSRSREEGR